MKKIFLFVAMVASATMLFAQEAKDLIYKTDYEVVEAKIIEVSSTEVKYKDWNNLDGPTFVLRSDEIGKITFANGQEKKFTTAQTNNVLPVSQNGTNMTSNSATMQSLNSKNGFQFNLDVDGNFTRNKETKLEGVTIPAYTSGGVSFDLGAGVRVGKPFYLGAALSFFGEWANVNTSVSGISVATSASAWLMPIYADMRLYIPTQSQCYPFFEVGLGGYVGLSGQSSTNLSGTKYEYSVKPKGGFYFTPSFGLEFRHFVLGIGYKLFHNSDANGNYGFVKIGISLGQPARLK